MGEPVFKRYCASCHGVSGAGDGPVVEALAVHVPDLREISVRGGDRFSREWLYRIIDGRVSIVAHGTHDDLMRTTPAYARILDALLEAAMERDVAVMTDARVARVVPDGNGGAEVVLSNSERHSFDKVVVTTPAPTAAR